MHLTTRLGKLHLALALGQTDLFLWRSLVMAMGTTHAFDVVR